MDQEQLIRALGGPEYLRYFPEIDSTSSYARLWARQGAPHGAVVLADRQTAGRGRMGRRFFSPEGGLYMSLILDSAHLAPGQLTTLAAVAAREAALALTGESLEIKWVNDLLRRGRKVCGILAEGILGEEGLQRCVIGIGVNLGRMALLEALIPIAGTLYEEGRHIAPERCACASCPGSRRACPRPRPYGALSAHCVTLGRRVSATREEVRGSPAISMMRARCMWKMTGVIRLIAGEVSIRPSDSRAARFSMGFGISPLCFIQFKNSLTALGALCILIHRSAPRGSRAGKRDADNRRFASQAAGSLFSLEGKMDGKLTKKEFLGVSLMLFAMFFGSGNLIFPPMLGNNAGTATLPSLLGFAVTAVAVPVLGILAVAKTNGVKNLGARVGPLFALVYPALIFLSIGPGIAIPRNGSLAFEMSVLPYLGGVSPVGWRLAYTLVFFACGYYLSLTPSKLVDRMGKLMTPVLLALIVVFFAGSVAKIPVEVAAPSPAYARPGIKGFLEGYNTMDALASLNFGLIIALTIRRYQVKEEKSVIRYASGAGLIAGVILLAVYAMLAYVGQISSVQHAGATNGQISSSDRDWAVVVLI